MSGMDITYEGVDLSRHDGHYRGSYALPGETVRHDPTTRVPGIDPDAFATTVGPDLRKVTETIVSGTEIDDPFIPNARICRQTVEYALEGLEGRYPAKAFQTEVTRNHEYGVVLERHGRAWFAPLDVTTGQTAVDDVAVSNGAAKEITGFGGGRSTDAEQEDIDDIRREVSSNPVSGEFAFVTELAVADERGPVRLLSAPMWQDATDAEILVANRSIDDANRQEETGLMVAGATIAIGGEAVVGHEPNRGTAVYADLTAYADFAASDAVAMPGDDAHLYAALAMGRLRGMDLIATTGDEERQDEFEAKTLIPMLTGRHGQTRAQDVADGVVNALVEADLMRDEAVRMAQPTVLQVLDTPITAVRDHLGLPAESFTITLDHEPEFRSDHSGARTMLLHGRRDDAQDTVLAIYEVPDGIAGSPDREDRFNDMARRLGGGDRVTLIGQREDREWCDAGNEDRVTPLFVASHFVRGDVPKEKLVDMSWREPGSFVETEPAGRRAAMLGMRFPLGPDGPGL